MYFCFNLIDIKPGHIPGSQCMFWVDFLSDGVYKSAEQLAELYKKAGIDINKVHTATCGTGMYW